MWRNRKTVLGVNARSAIYLRVNSKRSRDLADNKLETKQLLIQHGIPVAELLGVIRDPLELRQFDWEALPASFVIKPNRGFGGDGILVIFNRLKNGNWLTTHQEQLNSEDLAAHAHNILDGNYSLFSTPDSAIIERRLSVDPLFKHFATEGIPDIRVIVYNLVPVMAMIRVPTKKSRGKANLAQGGLGIGVDIATGLTTHVITKSWLYEKEIDLHPDTHIRLRGLKVPYWSDILKIAVMSARVLGLNYCGVDISADKKLGPMVLELNARPGFGIQIANMAPLRERLDRIRGLKVETPERGIAIARELFSGHYEEEIASVTGRQVIGLIEPVTLYGKDKKTIQLIKAKIDTGADNSSIDIAMARELGFGGAIDAFEARNVPSSLTEEQANVLAKELEASLMKEQPDIRGLSVVSSSHGTSLRIRIPLSISLAGHKMDIEPTVIDRSHLTYPILVGRRHLSHYLIDATKQSVVPTKTSSKSATKPVPKPKVADPEEKTV